jgi:hypothetical protein
MRKIVTIASTAEIKKAPSFYDLLKNEIDTTFKRVRTKFVRN